MNSRAWPGYGPDDMDSFSNLVQHRIETAEPLPLTYASQDEGASVPRHVASLSPKSVSFDVQPSKKLWDKLDAEANGPRHNTYPSPHTERDIRWVNSSSPSSRNDVPRKSSADTAQMRAAFESSLGVPAAQDRSLSASLVECDTSSPSRAPWDRPWPSAPQNRGIPTPDVSMGSWGLGARPPPAAEVMYGARDPRWTEANYLPTGAKWVAPVPYAEGAPQAMPAWAVHPTQPVPPRRMDGGHSDRFHQEISTLFIAGFPDDITDREFANMFLFAKGFEASMLKHPTPPPNKGEEGEHETKEGQHESANVRNKQIIGFAKFYTREEALEAREVLNGFRVDQDRGCILKAELAKKNLHTKRSAPFVPNKPNHAAPRSASLYDPQATLEAQAAYAAVMSGYAPKLPTPLNTSLAEYARDPNGMIHSAPPRLDPMVPSPGVVQWPTPQPYEAPVSGIDPMAYPAPGAPAAVPPLFDSARMPLPVNIKRGPHAESGLSDPRLLPRDSNPEAFSALDAAGQLGRMHLGNGVPRPDAVNERGGYFGHDAHDVTGAAARANNEMSSFIALGPQRHSPVSMYRPVASPQPESESDPDRGGARGASLPSAGDGAGARQGDASGSLHSSPSASVELDMDAMTGLEQASYAAGFARGTKQGEQYGFREGRTLGREKGFEIWEEIGYYLGTIRMWRHILRQEPSSNRKAQKQLQHLSNLESLIREMPTQNDSSLLEQPGASNDSPDKDAPDLQKLLERIRARFKLASSSLGTPGYPPLLSSTPVNSAEERLETAQDDRVPKPRLARVGGQMVDVNQLKY